MFKKTIVLLKSLTFNLKSNLGFSLIEMLVVITIIGLLAGVVMVSTNSARIAGRDTKRKADIEALSAAMELYYSQNKTYPLQATWIQADNLRTTLTNFITSWPTDPRAQIYSYCTGGGYCYISDTTGAKFLLDVVLEKNEGSSSCVEDTTSATFFESTICKDSNNKSHYRVAGK